MKNILVASRSPIRVKIGDFGVSKRAVGTSLNTRVGTEGYKAPEIHFGTGSYTNAADMWSLGCLVHRILTSEIPFLRKDANSIPESGFLITSQQCDSSALYRFGHSSDSVGFPPGVLNESLAGKELDFLKGLLQPTPARRMSAPAALKHPWLQPTPVSQMSAPVAPKHPWPQVQAKIEDCYLESLVSFIKYEKPSLMQFFPGDLNKVLIPYAEQAQRFAMRLERFGCPAKTACDLAVLTLYDLAILIGNEGSLHCFHDQRVCKYILISCHSYAFCDIDR